MESKSSLGHVPDGKWAFDRSVVECFEDMFSRSIPDYEQFRRATHSVAVRHVRPYSTVVDVGASLGGGLFPLVGHAELTGIGKCRFVGFDSSDDMVAAATVIAASRQRLGPTKAEVEFRVADLREASNTFDPRFPTDGTSLILSTFTLQFVPVEHRQRILADAYRNLKPGGCLVLAEKCLAEDGEAQPELVRLYHDRKVESGYTRDEVEAKRASLENSLVPLKASWNEDLLRGAGFRVVQRYWQAFSFCSWFAIK